MARANEEKGAGANGYAALHRWSVEEPEAFWELVWDDAGIVGDKGAAPFFIEDGGPDAGGALLPPARGSTTPKTCSGSAAGPRR